MKRLRVIAIVVAVLLAGCLVIYFATPKEPSYQGRTLTQWFWKFNRLRGDVAAYDTTLPPHLEEFKSSERAIRAIGTNAIPTLLAWVRDAKSTPIRERLNLLLERQTLIRFRFRLPVEKLWMAEECFDLLGTNALPAVPALVQLLQSPKMYQRQNAIDALSNITHDRTVMLPLLLPLLHSSDEDVRFRAAFCLREKFPDEAEKAGVYEMFPRLKPSTTNSVPANPPAAK